MHVRIPVARRKFTSNYDAKSRFRRFNRSCESFSMCSANFLKSRRNLSLDDSSYPQNSVISGFSRTHNRIEQRKIEWTINAAFRLCFYHATRRLKIPSIKCKYIYVTRKFLHLKSAVSILAFYRVMQFYSQRMHNLRTRYFLPWNVRIR